MSGKYFKIRFSNKYRRTTLKKSPKKTFVRFPAGLHFLITAVLRFILIFLVFSFVPSFPSTGGAKKSFPCG